MKRVFYIDAMNRDDARQRFLDIEAMLDTLGGIVTIGAMRAQLEEGGEHETVRYRAEFETFAPEAKVVEPDDGQGD